MNYSLYIENDLSRSILFGEEVGTELKSSSSKFLGVMLTDHDSTSSSSKGMIMQSSSNRGHTDTNFHGTDVVGNLNVDSGHVEVEYKSTKTSLRGARGNTTSLRGAQRATWQSREARV